ncbi:MAG: flavodoxin family protein [Deltaproteobacteria bacterium]|nr:flavodoxin family protein [Candidatus Zymogenaceae bacterium]
MNILALIGSPRKGSNTELLIDAVMEGARTAGHQAEKLSLYDYDIKPCVDCRRCKRDDYRCALTDDMSAIYPRLRDADLIIFGTPVYWYGPTAKMKLLVDRLRPFIADRGLAGKKGLVVVPSEEGAACCGPLSEMFRMSFGYLGMEPAGEILAAAYERGEIKKSPNELKRAREKGASL